MPLLPGAEPFAADAPDDAPGPRLGALLVHGFTGSPQSMRPWAEALAGAGLSVRLPRLPGHGTSWQEMQRTRWEDWYAEVERAFGELTARCDQVFVMGLSMGGTLALRLAEQQPDAVAGLVLVNPSVTTRNRAFPLLPVISRVLPSLAGVGNDIAKPGVTELAYDRTPLRAAASLGRLWRVVRADLGRVRAPLLLFRSPQDHVVEPENARIVLDGVGSSDTREVLLPDSYHVATLDHDAETIVAGSLAFVRAHAAAPTGGEGRPS